MALNESSFYIYFLFFQSKSLAVKSLDSFLFPLCTIKKIPFSLYCKIYSFDKSFYSAIHTQDLLHLLHFAALIMFRECCFEFLLFSALLLLLLLLLGLLFITRIWHWHSQLIFSEEKIK